MKFRVINGSPRKNCNTATILQHIIKGALNTAPDIDCERIDIYDHDYKGCISCYECKKLSGKKIKADALSMMG